MFGKIPGMTHVAVRVDSGSTSIPADSFTVNRDELILYYSRNTSWPVKLFFSLRPVTKDCFIVEKRNN